MVGLVLAGGQGKRLGGRDKAMVFFQARPLISHVLDRLSPQLGRMAISANGDPARFADIGLPVLADRFSDKGPLAGVHAGLIWATAISAQAVITASVDCPFLPGDLVSRLILASGPDHSRPAFARAGGRDQPTMALWPVGLLPKLEEHLSSGAPPRLAQFLIGQAAMVADFGDTNGFDNINTPEDLSRAEAKTP